MWGLMACVQGSGTYMSAWALGTTRPRFKDSPEDENV